MASRALQRTRTHVLDSARDFVEQHGVEQLSMRRLADEAGVSVRTLYNHFGDKEGLLTALVQRSLDSMDVAVHQLSSTDPIERIWEAITVSIDKVVADIPKAVVRAVLMDDRLLDQVNLRWSGWELILTEIKSAARRGALRDDIDPEILADHAAMVLFHLQRRWTSDDITADELRTSALHAFDICLLAIARSRARTRILSHANSMLTANQAAAEA